MPYAATIPVEFPCRAERVYEALCDLATHPLWNSGMRWMSAQGRMHEGLEYETESIAAGHTIRSHVEVVRLVQNRVIELDNKSGAITFRALFELTELQPGHTQVVCNLQFSFQKFVLDLARPAIESMAQARLRGDLEALRAIVCADSA